jgi:hypothetical protein
MAKRSILLPLISGTVLMTIILAFGGPAEIPNLPGDYEKEWKKVDSLSGQGLPKSALLLVENIYKKAKAEGNYPQVVKALLHKAKFSSAIEDDATVKIISELEKEIKTAPEPLKQILHSITAEVYWSYYENNRWRFLERTATEDFKQEDILTWDLRKIMEVSLAHYRASVENPALLKGIKLGMYDAILLPGKGTRKYRPTLYDFLAHRAVDFYAGEEPGLTRPAEKFELDDPDHFKPYHEFAKLEISTNDSFALEFYALDLFRDIIAFHAADREADALVDADLERLDFVWRKSVLAGKDSLYLQALHRLEQKFIDLPVSTVVSYEIARFYQNQSAKYNRSEGEKHRFDRKLAHEKCLEAIKRFPESAGAKDCRILLKRIEQKQLEVKVEKVNLSNAPFRALINYTNNSKLYFRLVKVAADEADQQSRRSYEEALKIYAGMPAVKQWSMKLPDEGDFMEHATEIEIPALSGGMYALLASNDSGQVKKGSSYITSFTLLAVSDLSYIYKRQSSHYDVHLLHRESGKPLQGAFAQVWNIVYNQTSRTWGKVKGASFTTDDNGYFHLPVNSGRDQPRFMIEFMHSGEKLFSDPIYAYHYDPSTPDTTTLVKAHFFTDRSIYRPGQTIHFKGLMTGSREGQHSIKAGYKTTVIFQDANDQQISEQNFTSNEFGTFSGTFTAPVGRMNGSMAIVCDEGEVEVQVEEYKRPKFEVAFEPVKESYRLGETVTVKGNAKTYAGAVIDNSKINYRVVRSAIFPFMDRFSWWKPFPSVPDLEITNGVALTDEKGEFAITFKAIPDLSAGREFSTVFNYTVSVDVTDANGETRSASKVVSAGYIALLANVDIPESINREEKKTFKINTSNLNGEFEAAKGKITVYRLVQPGRIFRSRLWEVPDMFTMSREEYYKKFPYDLYDDENNKSKWKKEKVAEFDFDTEKSKDLSWDLTEWQTGEYSMELVTEDKYKQPVKFSAYFLLFSPSEKQMPLDEIAWFKLLDKSARPGEKARLLIGSRDKDVKAFYELEYRGKQISKTWITLDNEQKLVEIPVGAGQKGEVMVRIIIIKHSRHFVFNEAIKVKEEKGLLFEFETFRDKLLPGEKEEWRIKLKREDGQKLTEAEVAAGMYDMSLDVFVPHSWELFLQQGRFPRVYWELGSFGMTSANVISTSNYESPQPFDYDRLNWFGYYPSGRRVYQMHGNTSYGDAYAVMEPDAAYEEQSTAGAAKMKEVKMNNQAEPTLMFAPPALQDGKEKQADLSIVQPRTNFNETAFFYPQLKTNENGEVIISFTMPDALTRWKLLAFAHTRELQFGFTEKQLITQKQIMVTQNAPRFFREDDKITFTAKVSNLTDTAMNGSAQLFLSDALTGLPLTILKEGGSQSFTAKAQQSSSLSWEISIPEGLQALTYRVVAKSGNHSDGEEMTAPVLSNRMLVTESMPLPVRGNQTRTFEFSRLINSNSPTLKNHKLTLEFTSNPAWNAIQALPYLMEYPYDCAEQMFSRYYANSIGTHIANSSPRIRQVFDSWKNITPGALLSNLEKNQELKSALLEETPWVLQSQDEGERKRRVALLFDLNRMSNELQANLDKLKQLQLTSGGWPWFKGMADDRYITQHIATGMGHLDHLGIKDIRGDKGTWNMVADAVRYLDDRIREDYEWLIKHKADLTKQQLGSLQIQYLYARSYFKDVPVAAKNKKAFDFYLGQSAKYWLQQSRYMQGMTALALKRYQQNAVAAAIMKSLKEHSLSSDEMGMYWKENTGGYYWHQAPIETQALLIEAFDEVSNDMKSVEEMKIWLLKQKQTQDWRTTKATTEACYALLLRGTNVLSSQALVDITMGALRIDPNLLENTKVEAGTGYFKTSWMQHPLNPKWAG